MKEENSRIIKNNLTIKTVIHLDVRRFVKRFGAFWDRETSCCFLLDYVYDAFLYLGKAALLNILVGILYFQKKLLSIRKSSLQDVITVDDSSADSVTYHFGDWKLGEFGHCDACSSLNCMRCGLFLCLCNGLWTNSKHPLLRDVPDHGPWPLHCHMRLGVLDW